ncbi:hypothetical protein CUMW_083530 [Citrus unshiu]|nr:hypothetical protein CUMW_083530 [Citrus unshiu]
MINHDKDKEHVSRLNTFSHTEPSSWSQPRILCLVLLIADAFKMLPREKVQIATKFGVVGLRDNGVIVKGTPDYVRSCCEASLKRLDVDYIDLYYQHRVDTSVPIEETVSDLNSITCHAIDWRNEEAGGRGELGIGIVPYSPLGHGFFGGKAVVESVPADSFLHFLPRFKGENLNRNKSIYFRIENLAKKYNCTSAQLALAWVLGQGDDVVPIPGTTKIKNLDDNIDSLRIKLTKEDLKEISDAVPIEEFQILLYFVSPWYKVQNSNTSNSLTPSFNKG